MKTIIAMHMSIKVNLVMMSKIVTVFLICMILGVHEDLKAD